MSKHSAGPWRVALSNFKLGPQGGRDILNQHGPIARKVFWEDDARLIAAAPDMLEALKEWAEAFDSFAEGGEQLTRLGDRTRRTKDLIAKAEGRDGR